MNISRAVHEDGSFTTIEILIRRSLTGKRFIGAWLPHANLKGAILHEAEFSHADFTNADRRGANPQFHRSITTRKKASAAGSPSGMGRFALMLQC